MNCYDDWWLPRDMENMGYIFEYCDKYCKELFDVEIDKYKFLDTFMRSELRKQMESGHPMLLSQSGRDTVRKFVLVDLDGNLDIYKGKSQNIIENQWYWVGWIYAYIHYKSKLSSKKIVNKLPLKKMLKMYYLGHEQSKETFYDRLVRENLI